MITVYTPTYNRGFIISNLYNSLLRQSNQNFEWLIIDDGSEDNTHQLVSQWIEEDKIKIRYFHQENKGKMEALNLAHDLIETELNVCIDSDDYLVDVAIEIILSEWEKVKGNKKIAGLVGLDVFKTGEVVGTKFPEDLKYSKFSHFFGKITKGDKKFVYRTDVVKKYPKYPSFPNEKFPAPGYLYRLIDQDYDLYLINKVLCVVEYLEDGISKNKYLQFRKYPNSFMFYRLELIRLSDSFLDKYKSTVHYVSSCLFAQKSFFNNKYFYLIILALLPGLILNLYLRFTSKKNKI
jgi:glycosyltransferase involved in cell wall biosynthesis